MHTYLSFRFSSLTSQALNRLRYSGPESCEDCFTQRANPGRQEISRDLNGINYRPRKSFLPWGLRTLRPVIFL